MAHLFVRKVHNGQTGKRLSEFTDIHAVLSPHGCASFLPDSSSRTPPSKATSSHPECYWAMSLGPPLGVFSWVCW